jgi:hypothetical protein
MVDMLLIYWHAYTYELWQYMQQCMSVGSRIYVCFLGKVDNAEIFETAIFFTSMPVGGNTCYKMSQCMCSGIKMFATSKK